jgi:hypothetical protein
MIANMEQIVSTVPAMLMQAVVWIFGIWTGWAVWTVLMCAPIYLIAIGLAVFGIGNGTVSTVVRRTVMVNAIVAMAPIALPVLALWYGVPFVYSLATCQPTRRRNQQQGPRVVHNHYYLNGQRQPQRGRGGQHRPRQQPLPPARP